MSVSLRERVKEKYRGSINAVKSLLRIFQALNSSKAKWMVSILLKDYSPVHVLKTLAMQQFYFLLPNLLRFQSSLKAAVKLLSEPTSTALKKEAEIRHVRITLITLYIIYRYNLILSHLPICPLTLI